MIRTFGCGLAALGAAAVIGMGMGAAAQPAPKPSSEQAAPAAGAPVDPQQMALARRMIAVVSGETNFQAMFKAMNAQMAQALRAQPGADPALIDRMMSAGEKVDEQMLPDLKDTMARAYATHLTRQEMEDSIAFYDSPSGRSIMRKLPALTAEMAPLLVRWMPRIRAEVIKAVCAGDACTPAERQAVAALDKPPPGGPAPVATP